MMLLINLSIKFTQYRKHPALGNLCISLGRSAMTKSPQSDDHRDAIDAFQNDGDGRGNQMGGIFVHHHMERPIKCIVWISYVYYETKQMYK